MRSLLRFALGTIFLLGLAGAFVATLFEPMAEEVWRSLGVNSKSWAAPMMGIFADWGYWIAITFGCAFVGAFAHHLAAKWDRRNDEKLKSLARSFKEVTERITQSNLSDEAVVVHLIAIVANTEEELEHIGIDIHTTVKGESHAQMLIRTSTFLTRLIPSLERCDLKSVKAIADDLNEIVISYNKKLEVGS